MYTHMDNTDLILQGCNTLINTTVNGNFFKIFIFKPNYTLRYLTEENVLAAGKARAIESIVKALNKHANNANVCESIYKVLLNLAVNGKQRQLMLYFLKYTFIYFLFFYSFICRC